MSGLPPDTPVMKLFREWEAMLAAEEALPPGTPDQVSDAMLFERIALENRLCETPSQCAADFAAKLVAFTSWGDCTLTKGEAPAMWEEACQLLEAGRDKP